MFFEVVKGYWEENRGEELPKKLSECRKKL